MIPFDYVYGPDLKSLQKVPIFGTFEKNGSICGTFIMWNHQKTVLNALSSSRWVIKVTLEDTHFGRHLGQFKREIRRSA